MNTFNINPLDVSGAIGRQRENANYLRDSINNGIVNVGKGLDMWAKDKRQWQDTMEQRRYQRERDALADKRYEENLAYQRQRDAIADARYAQEQARIEQERQEMRDAMNLDKAMVNQNFYNQNPNNYDIDFDSEEQFLNDLENGSDIDNMPSIAYGQDRNRMIQRLKTMNGTPSDFANYKTFDNRPYADSFAAQQSQMEMDARNSNIPYDPYAKLRKYGDAAIMYFNAMNNARSPEAYNSYRNALTSIINQHEMSEMTRLERLNDEKDAAKSRIQDLEMERLKYENLGYVNPEWKARIEQAKSNFERKYGEKYDSSDNVGLQAGIEQKGANNAAYQAKKSKDLAEVVAYAQRFSNPAYRKSRIEHMMDARGYKNFKYDGE